MLSSDNITAMYKFLKPFHTPWRDSNPGSSVLMTTVLRRQRKIVFEKKNTAGI
jgi:hypothetical protein